MEQNPDRARCIVLTSARLRLVPQSPLIFVASALGCGNDDDSERRLRLRGRNRSSASAQHSLGSRRRPGLLRPWRVRRRNLDTQSRPPRPSGLKANQFSRRTELLADQGDAAFRRRFPSVRARDHGIVHWPGAVGPARLRGLPEFRRLECRERCCGIRVTGR